MGSVARLPRKVTFSDLQRLPEDGPRYELYDGELWEMPSPTNTHQFCVGRCFRCLADYADLTGGMAFISPLDIVFSEYDVVQPDVVFFNAARKGVIDWGQPIRDAPDLVVEALSPSTNGNDRGRKLRMFARYGVPEYWILNPSERTFEVRSLHGEDYVVGQTATCGKTVVSATLPDLVCEVSKVFVDC
jgi:Uma2 family endonuclease